MVYFVSGVGIVFFSTCPNCLEGAPILLFSGWERFFCWGWSSQRTKADYTYL